MAARWLRSRLLPHLVRRYSNSTLLSESNRAALASPPSRVLSGFESFRQAIHTQPEPSKHVDEVSPPSETNTPSAVKYTVASNLKVSPRHNLALIYTCKVCETRSIKTICHESYEKGVVVVRCDGCQNLHLIADRLGWFGEPGSIEELLASRGEEMKKGSVDSLNLTLEDLAGKKLTTDLCGQEDSS
ncbi:DNL-type zinc finger protein-like protein [Drosera capensis]